ncbi:MAG TPA: peptidylprolyl isomerase [Vicinamibacterales bacterium]|nr:peptidylprolyl isomerase [Vicinamibacterales bacterium]
MTIRVCAAIAILLFPVLTLGAGCKKSTPEAAAPAAVEAKAAQAAPSAPPAPPKPVPAELPEVVARVNGHTVSRADFQQALQNLEAQAGGPVPAERRDGLYREVLDQLVAFRLLVQESRARNVTVPDAEVNARVAEIRKQFPDDQAFNAALAQRQTTGERLATDIREQLAAMKLVETAVTPTVSVSDAELNAFYKENPERFQQPEAVRTAHILIRIPEKADAAARKSARAQADRVRAAAFKGEDFAALAKQNSQDQGSAVNGGDLGFIARGQTVPAFEEAAFTLKPGQVSQVVETTFGYHVIKVGEHRTARTVPLDEVKGEVTEFLKQQQMQEKTAAFVTGLKDKGKVEILF